MLNKRKKLTNTHPTSINTIVKVLVWSIAVETSMFPTFLLAVLSCHWTLWTMWALAVHCSGPLCVRAARGLVCVWGHRETKCLSQQEAFGKGWGNEQFTQGSKALDWNTLNKLLNNGKGIWKSHLFALAEERRPFQLWRTVFDAIGCKHV